LPPGTVPPERCGIGRRNREVEARARSCPAARAGFAARVRAEPARRKLRIDIEIACRSTSQHEAGAAGTFLAVGKAAEPEHREQLRTIVCCEIAVEIEFERVTVERIADCLRCKMQPRLAGLPVHYELRNYSRGAFRSGVHRQIGAQLERREAGDDGRSSPPRRR